jgi:hypothetical protein
MTAKINKLQTNSKTNNIRDLYRGINDFETGYQPRTNIAKDENDDLLTDSHCILARWRNHFSQLLNVRGVSDVRQSEMQTAEPVVPEPSAFEADMSIKKLKRHRPPGTDQSPAEFIKERGQDTSFRDPYTYYISLK